MANFRSLGGGIMDLIGGEWKDITCSFYSHGTTTTVSHSAGSTIKYKTIGNIVALDFQLSGLPTNTDIDVVIAANIPEEIKTTDSNIGVRRGMLVSDYATGIYANFTMSNTILRVKTHDGNAASGMILYLKG